MVMSGRTVWHIPNKPGRNSNPSSNRPEWTPANLAEFSMPAVFNRAGYDTMRTCKRGNSYEAANKLFTVRNDGGIFHELRFTNAERIADHLGEGDEGHDSDNAEHSEDETGQDVVIELDPGESGQVELVVPESEDVYTEAVCLVPGHYEAGMAASLVYARP